jgi:hypothetical protein
MHKESSIVVTRLKAIIKDNKGEAFKLCPWSLLKAIK